MNYRNILILIASMTLISSAHAVTGLSGAQATNAEETISVSGTWSGPMKNSKGQAVKKSTLKLSESLEGKIEGTWHAGWKVQKVKRHGNLITWEHHGLNKGCRDYKNRMIVAEGGNAALLSYSVFDRCQKPHAYHGRVDLSRRSR